MKRAILAALAMFVTVGVMAQGNILFQNKSGTAIDAKVVALKPDGSPVPANVYTAELLAGLTQGSLAPTGITTPITLATGYFAGGSKSVPGIPAGVDAFFQVRIYNTAKGSFAASGLDVGASKIWSMQLTAPPNTPAAMAGLGKDPIVVGVPEPSILALGLLGMGALMLRRRS